jgi:hypothetical protein
MLIQNNRSDVHGFAKIWLSLFDPERDSFKTCRGTVSRAYVDLAMMDFAFEAEIAETNAHPEDCFSRAAGLEGCAKSN